MQLVGVIQSELNAGDQWRIVRPYTRLRQAGIAATWVTIEQEPDVVANPETTVLVVRLVSGVDHAATDRWLAARSSRYRAIVFEFDDVLWSEAMVDHLEDAAFMRGRSRDELLRQGDMARYFASRCDGVIVSSDPLAAMMREHTDRPVVVVPNAIDVRWFRSHMAYRAPWGQRVCVDQSLTPPPRYPRLTIGWAGGRRPEADVVPMATAWGRIARRYRDVAFVLASPLVPDVFYREVDDIDRIIRLPWHEWDEYPVIYQTDIGCCAVADTPFSRAKTPIKAWEYTVAGATVVGTPTLYGDCLRHGGFPAVTVDDWEHALSYLIEHPEVRVRRHAEMLAHVEAEHALDQQSWRWFDACLTIAGSLAGALVAV